MMPKDNPVHVPAYLLGDADPEDLDALMRDCRRLDAHWPHPCAAEDPAALPHHGFSVTRHSAELIENMSDYGD